jgi:cyanate permease
MHKTMLKQGNAALIVGLLVVLMVAGLFKLLWLSINAPIVWVVLLAWLLLPVLPFVIRLIALRLSPPKREVDGIC